MPLRDSAKKKALQFIEDVYRQIDPDAHTSTGSAIRSLLMVPFAVTYAAIFQEYEEARQMFLGNFAQLSESDMDRLGREHFVDRPPGSRATTELEVYLEQAETFTLRAFPYFSTKQGVSFRPIEQMSFTLQDILQNDDGLFVRVPVIAETFGQAGVAGTDEITEYDNMPVAVQTVTNPSATKGGQPRASNSEYFQAIQRAQNDNGIDQANGLAEHVLTTYDSVQEVEIVQAGHPRMLRGEVWSEDGSTPIRQRKGAPLAEHTTWGGLDFEALHGRVRAPSDTFEDHHIGRRVQIEDDPTHLWRTIRDVVGPREAIISGPDLNGTRDVTLWEEGPKIRDVSDAYLRMPALEIQSQIVDQSFLLEADADVSQGDTTIPYRLPDDAGYDALPDKGRLVIGEGTSAEEIHILDGRDADTLTLVSGLDQDVSAGQALIAYDMDQLDVGDQLEAPVLYVLRIDTIDPTSREVDQELTRTTPGVYDQPGWYWQIDDPATLHSPRSNKTLVVDEKRQTDARRGLQQRGVPITQVAPAYNRLQMTGDFEGMEGRKVTITLPDRPLSNSGVAGADADRVDQKKQLDVDSLNAEYFSTKGHRDRGVEVVLYDKATGDEVATYDDARVFGDHIRRANDGTFDIQDTAGNYTVDVNLTGEYTLYDQYPSMEGDIEAIIVRPTDQTGDGQKESLDVLLPKTDTNPDGALRLISDEEGLATQAVTVTLASEQNDGASRPLRVIYATHSDIQGLQRTLDSAEDRLVCDDVLARSMRPSLIDASLTYQGSATPEQMRQRFVDLVTEAARQYAGDKMRLDLSNIIARLDEEGLADWVDLDPEIRVTNILSDGAREVRYLNPSEATKQKLALDGDINGADANHTVHAQDVTPPLPGRGTLYLGGNDPNRQEIAPYEAVIVHEDDTATFILRDGWGLSEDHYDWETVFATTRDYEPRLAFDGQAVTIPAENRPYVRQLVIQKQ